MKLVMAIFKVSVIVPVYNCEKNVGRCIESILNQKLKDLELILVNDGSTDRSLEIIKKYAANNDRIKIIDKPNGGVSSARNAGLDAATGEYIGFVDADDWIHPEMYSSMYDKITKTHSDICICNYIVEYPDQRKYMSLNTGKNVVSDEYDKKRLILNIIAPKDLNINSFSVMGSAWRLLVKKELIMENNIRFPLGIPLMEDLVFCLNAFIKSRQIVIDKGFHYHYFIDSLSSYKEDIYLIHKKVFIILENILRENNLYTFAQERLKIRYINMCLSTISNEASFSNRKKLTDKLKHIKRICKDKKLKEMLRSLSTKNLKVRRKLLLFALKHELEILLYAYFKIVIFKYNFKFFSY